MRDLSPYPRRDVFTRIDIRPLPAIGNGPSISPLSRPARDSVRRLWMPGTSGRRAPSL